MRTKEAFKEAIKKTQNLEEFFKVCNEFYDLKNAKLGTITKGIFIANIDKILVMTGAKLKL